MPIDEAMRPAERLLFRRTGMRSGERLVAVETPVAISYGGSTQAVLMASPADLDDFAVGFTLTEGIVDDAAEIEAVERLDLDRGIELQVTLAGDRQDRLARRRRAMAGPVGCGLCGIESLEAAARPLRRVETAAVFEEGAMLEAMAAMAPMQALNDATHAVHAAAIWHPTCGVGPLREDVGRHNALDKLAGALVRWRSPVGESAVLLTSRVSVEMVQKTAVIGAPMIVAVSAPTSLAIEAADAAGITLVAVARADGFEVFTHAGRVAGAMHGREARLDVA